MGAGMEIRLARPEDSEALCAMLERAPMGRQIRLTFERRPDYFLGAAVQAEEPEVYVADAPGGGLAGVFAAGKRRVYVEGEPRNIRYLSDLRIDPAHRGGRWLLRGWRHLRENVFAPGEFAQTLILSDNADVLALLTSGRAGLPRYEPAGAYRTHFLAARQRPPRSRRWRVARAGPHDAADMQALVTAEGPRKAFFPCWDFGRLGRTPHDRNLTMNDFFLARDGEGMLAGMVGVWDQSAFRQTRIRGYGGWARWGRPLSRFAAGVALPRPGETLPLRYLTAILCRGNDPAVFRALLGAVIEAHRSWNGYLVAGLDGEDRLHEALRGLRRRTVEGRHFLVTFAARAPGFPGPFHFESSRL